MVRTGLVTFTNINQPGIIFCPFKPQGQTLGGLYEDLPTKRPVIVVHKRVDIVTPLELANFRFLFRNHAQYHCQ